MWLLCCERQAGCTEFLLHRLISGILPLKCYRQTGCSSDFIVSEVSGRVSRLHFWWLSSKNVGPRQKRRVKYSALLSLRYFYIMNWFHIFSSSFIFVSLSISPPTIYHTLFWPYPFFSCADGGCSWIYGFLHGGGGLLWGRPKWFHSLLCRIWAHTGTGWVLKAPDSCFVLVHSLPQREWSTYNSMKCFLFSLSRCVGKMPIFFSYLFFLCFSFLNKDLCFLQWY